MQYEVNLMQQTQENEQKTDFWLYFALIIPITYNKLIVYDLLGQQNHE